MQACFEPFCNNAYYWAQSHALTAYALAKHLKDKKDISSQNLLQSFMCSWSDSALLWFDYFRGRGLENTFWVFSILNIVLSDQLFG